MPSPPVSNRGVQIANGQPLCKVETLMPSGFWAFESYVKNGHQCHRAQKGEIFIENNEWIWHFREERERNGISRKAVAAVAGISREYLCRLETGKLPVTDKTRKRLTAALKTLYPDPLNLMIDYVRVRFPTMDARHIIPLISRSRMWSVNWISRRPRFFIINSSNSRSRSIPA